MPDADMLFWGVLMLLGFLGSALFSGMETGAYRLNRVRLYVQAAQGRSAAKSLERIVAKPASLIGTLLIGNNLCNYLGTAGLGVILASMQMPVWQAVLVNTVLVTLVLFIFGETLPKDLFAAYCDILMYPLAKLLVILKALFTWTGVLPIVVAISALAIRLVGKGEGGALTPRKRVAQMVREGAGAGLISSEQTEIAQRALALSNRRVLAECTPWTRVVTILSDLDREAVRRVARQTPRSRLPVVDGRGRIVGVVDMIEALLVDPKEPQPVKAAMNPAVYIDGDATVRQALTRLQRDHIGLAVVKRQDGKPAGIVTVKDLVEPLTGEIANW
ncbi:MAG: CNNM domain-containing protein [Phycisphaeraceae bacterium]